MSLESDKIIEVASRFVGLYETATNAAWDDPTTAGADPAAVELKRLMEVAGWKPGWPYCMALCEAVWTQAYRELGAPAAMLEEIAAKCNPSTVSSLANWSDRVVRVPAPGAVFFMQKGRTPHGHAGIVAQVASERMATIEGNTSPDPKDAEQDREGDGIFRRNRACGPDAFVFRAGLYLRGFLHPLEIP